MMDYEQIPGGHRWNLDGGMTIEVLDPAWSASGRLYGQVKVIADDGMGVLGASQLELSDVGARTRLSQELANHNGSNPVTWADHLLAIYASLDDQRRSSLEHFGPVSLAEFDEPEPLRWIVDKIVPENMPSQIYGDGAQGKSTLLDYLALCVQMGQPFFEFATIPGQVVILDWELDLDATLRRCFAIARGMGFNSPPPVHYQSLYAPLATHIPDLIAWCQNVNPVLVLVDSMGPAAGGDPTDHAKAIELMSSLRRTKCASIVADHQSKPSAGQSYIEKRAFGSGFKGFLTRSHLQLEMIANVPGKASSILRHAKNNFGPKIEPLAFHTIYDLGRIRFEIADITEPEFQPNNSLPIPLRIERFLQEAGPSEREEIMKACSIAKEQSFNNAISTLRKQKKLPSAQDTMARPNGKKLYELL